MSEPPATLAPLKVRVAREKSAFQVTVRGTAVALLVRVRVKALSGWEASASLKVTTRRSMRERWLGWLATTGPTCRLVTVGKAPTVMATDRKAGMGPPVPVLP